MDAQVNTSTDIQKIQPSTALDMVSFTIPSAPIIIRGEITDIRYFPDKNNPKRIYGDISDENGIIEFSILPNKKLKFVGQGVEIYGMLQPTPKRFGSGFILQIKGELVGEYYEKPSSKKAIPYVSERGKVSLKRFLEQYQTQQLSIIATSRGKQDILSAHGDASLNERIQFVNCNFTDKQELIKTILNAAEQSNTRGICVARGGSKSTDMLLWDNADIVEALLKTEKPFYTALGHSDQNLLADKHSDEPFVTPSALGAAIKEIENDLGYKWHLRQTVEEQTKRINNFVPKERRLRKYMIYSIVINAVLIAFIIWYAALEFKSI